MYERQKQTSNLIKEHHFKIDSGFYLTPVTVYEKKRAFIKRKIGEHKPHYKPKLLTGKKQGGEKDIKMIYKANTCGPDPKKATPSSAWALTAIFLTLLLDLHHKSSKAKVKRHKLVELEHLARCYPQYHGQTRQLFPPSILHAFTLLFARLLSSLTIEPKGHLVLPGCSTLLIFNCHLMGGSVST